MQHKLTLFSFCSYFSVFQCHSIELMWNWSFKTMKKQITNGKHCYRRMQNCSFYIFKFLTNILWHLQALPLLETLSFRELADPRLGDYNMFEMYHMARTAYLCLQTDPELRPSMSEVITLFTFFSILFSSCCANINFGLMYSKWQDSQFSSTRSCLFISNLNRTC